MKKTILAFLMLLSLPIMADNVPSMVVTMSGGDTKEYIISNIQKITYSGSDMVITTSSNSTETISTDEIAKITLSGITATGIEDVTAQNAGAVSYVIYNIDGTQFSKGMTSDAKGLLNGLPSGKYIININGKTIKVVK